MADPKLTVSPGFFQAWRELRYAKALLTKKDESFWYSVLLWFSKIAIIEFNQIGPICDYLDFRRRGEPDFTMKGRTVQARLLRDIFRHLKTTKVTELLTTESLSLQSFTSLMTPQHFEAFLPWNVQETMFEER